MPTPDIHSDDYYKVLGVERSANDHEIGKAYKRLALKHHPDKNPHDKENAEENFKLITEAYDVLSNADKRKAYDQFGKAGRVGPDGPGGGVSFQQADDIFKAFFGGQDPFSMFFSQDDDGLFGGMGGDGGGPRKMFRSGPGGGGIGGMRGMPGGMFFDMGVGGMGMPGMGSMGKGMGSEGAFPQRRAPTPAYVLPSHTIVTIRGLVKAQEHNGKTGKISGWDEQKNRYSVALERDETLSFRPSNLTQRCDVEITGIESQPQVNGQFAEVLNYIDGQHRYQVKLKTQIGGGRDVISVRPNNVILQRGTRVIVTGLSNAGFNGQMAQIQDVDREAMRYTVLLQNGTAIKVKWENVLC